MARDDRQPHERDNMIRSTSVPESARGALLRLCICPAAALLLAGSAACAAGPAGLTLLRTVGGDDDAIMLHRPSELAFAPDGTAYVVNFGDCRVLHFDAGWNLLNEFGAQGEGPGEFSNPTGMIVHEDMVWVFEMARVTQYGLDGTYLRTLRSEKELHGPFVEDGRILARLGGASGRGAIIVDDDLQPVLEMGPECPTDDFFASYKKCGFMSILPHPDHLCILVNPLDGTLYAVDEAGDVVREAELVESDGRSHATEDDGQVSMTFTMVIGPGCVDHRGYLWTTTYSEDEESDEDSVLRVFDREFRPVRDYALPEDVVGSVRQDPDGNLVLLDGQGSQIHVLGYPEDLGGS
jgi:hypothetical protein